MTGYFLNILSLEEIIKLEKGEGSLENCFTILGWTREILPQKHTPHADTAMKQCFPSHNCMFQCFKCLIEIKVFCHTSFMNTCQKRNLIQSSIDGINRLKGMALVCYQTLPSGVKGETMISQSFHIQSLETYWSIGFERINATKGQDGQNLKGGDQVLFLILMFPSGHSCCIHAISGNSGNSEVTQAGWQQFSNINHWKKWVMSELLNYSVCAPSSTETLMTFFPISSGALEILLVPEEETLDRGSSLSLPSLRKMNTFLLTRAC